MTELGEFELIRRYFQRELPRPETIRLGIGDDAALLRVPAGQELVLSVDTQLANVHFPPDAPPADIAQRAFRCAISDLAAMGAQPLCCTLALTLPEARHDWLQAFSHGLLSACKRFHCPLVGGDTTKGALAITLQVHGLVPEGTALLRRGAQPGDVVLVSGYLGGAAGYVALMQTSTLTDPALAHAVELFSQDYFFPQPPLVLGQALRSRAHSAIDISDGLLADLQHLCLASGVNAELQLQQLPMLPELVSCFGQSRATELALCGGDDYQLCFTAPEQHVRKIFSLAEDMEHAVTVVGRTTAADTAVGRVTCYHADGQLVDPASLPVAGYRHF